MTKKIDVNKLPSFLYIGTNQNNIEEVKIDFEQLYENYGEKLLSHYTDNDIQNEAENRYLLSDSDLSDYDYGELLEELKRRNNNSILTDADYHKLIEEAGISTLLYAIVRTQHPRGYIDKQDLKDTINNLIDFYF